MIKSTRQKEAILKVLMNTRSHPTADVIYEEVRKDIPNISLGTVYRNLRQMKERGEIMELDFCGHLSRFDGNSVPHYHFMCQQCGSVFDIDCPVDEELNRKIAEKTGFVVTGHCLEFRGLCKACRTHVR
jgi:Fe2+ or Zn2+ uptake regulation protein